MNGIATGGNHFRTHNHTNTVQVGMPRSFGPFAGGLIRPVCHFPLVVVDGAHQVTVHDSLFPIENISVWLIPKCLDDFRSKLGKTHGNPENQKKYGKYCSSLH